MIDIEVLKANSLIHSNVDAKQLTVITNRSKLLYLRPILGEDFYNHLDTATTLTSDEQTLLDDYIYPFATVSTEILASVHLTWDMTNKGVYKYNDQYGNSTTFQDNATFTNYLKKQAQTYKEMLVTYLKDNKSLFPLYEASCKVEGVGTSLDSQFGFISARNRRRR